MIKRLGFLPLIIFLLLIVGLGYLFWRVGSGILTPPTPVSRVTSSLTLTSTTTSTPTPTATSPYTPTNTATPTPTPTSTPTPSATPTLTPTPPAITIVVPVSLKVRQRPNLASEIVDWLSEGAKVTIIGRNVAKNWLNILAPGGQVGWVKAGAVDAAEQGVAVADLPLVLSTPTPEPSEETGDAASFQPTESRPPRGRIILVSPDSQADQFFAEVEFEWRWEGEELPSQFGFEVLIWREGEDISSAHDAVLDNSQGRIRRIDDNHYHLTLNVTHAPGVENRQGVYLWTVKLIRVAPYDDNFGTGQIMADPEEFFFDS